MIPMKKTKKMWKVIALVLAITMAMPGFTAVFAEETTTAYGDVNADAQVNAQDALLVLKSAAKIEELNDSQKILADVNGDTSVDAKDALLILQKAAKIIDKFPIEEVEATETPENTEAPTDVPVEPTDVPVEPTDAPTDVPVEPTDAPTDVPVEPTDAPTDVPVEPTDTPTDAPIEPTDAPTDAPVDPDKLIAGLEVKDETYGSFWSIDSDLQLGDLVYGDRDRTFVAIDESLVGSEYIVTSCDSKNTTTDLAVVTAGKDMILSVGFDARVTTIPAWAADFTKTEITCENDRDVVFVIYQKEVKAGESVTLGAQGQSSGVVGYIVIATQKESTEAPDAPSDKLIAGLEVKDETYGSFWSIDSDLQLGDLVYGDRDRTFVAIDESLIGSEYVVTSCDSKNTTTDLAIVTAGKDMILSVGFDARVTTIPAWAADFTKTEITCENDRDVVFVIYQKEVKAGESVTLGAQGQSSGVVGYIAMATAK